MTRQSLFSRYFTLAGANFSAAIFGFFAIALMARKFGPAGFGEITLAITIIDYVIVATSFGTGLHAIKVVAGGKGSLETTMPIVVIIRLVLSMLALPLLMVLIFSLPNLYESRYIILLYGTTLFSNILLLLWVPQAVHRSNDLAVGNFMRQFLMFILLYYFLLYDSNLYFAPLARLTSDILVAAGLIFSMSRYVGRPGPIPNKEAILSFLRSCAPVGLTQLMRAFSLATDLIILGLMTGRLEVGIYAAAFRIFLFTITLGNAYFVILLPRMAEISNSIDLLKRELDSSFRRVVPVLGCALVAIFLSADILIRLLFGDEYSDAANVLRILCLAAAAATISGHYRQTLLVRNMQSTELRCSTIAGGVHVLSKIGLISLGGITGCAFGTLIGEVYLLISLRRAAINSLANS